MTSLLQYVLDAINDEKDPVEEWKCLTEVFSDITTNGWETVHKWDKEANKALEATYDRYRVEFTLASRRLRILNKQRKPYIDVYKGEKGIFVASRPYTREDGTTGRSSLNSLFIKKEAVPEIADARFHAPLFVEELIILGVITA